MKRKIFGRREVTPEEEAKYAKINKIDGINELYEEYNITNDDILSMVTDMKNYEKYLNSNDNHNGCIDERDIHVSEYIDILLNNREFIRKLTINK